MDTKSKNKELYIIALLVAVYMFGFSTLSACDAIRNRKYLVKDPYFNSQDFKNEMSDYFRHVQTFYVDNKNYDKKTDEGKLSSEELEDLKDKDKQYEEAKSYLLEKKNIIYYIKDMKNNKTYTNIENVEKISNIDNYIKENSLYSIKLSRENKDTYQYSINTEFVYNGLEGYFIIPKEVEKYSQIHADYEYYKSVQNRIIKEIILGIVSLILGIFILKYVTRNNEIDLPYIHKLRQMYGKVPLDIRIIIFIICSFTMINMSGRTFFHKPFGMGQFFILTFGAIYTVYFILSLMNLKYLIKDDDYRKIQFNISLLYKFSMSIKDSFIIKSLAFKAIIVSIITMILGMFVAAFLSSQDGIYVIFILLYLMIVPAYVLRKIGILNKIIKGTEEIASGNLDYIIEEKGDVSLSNLAHNINNMKEGFRKSLESEMKSERLKSELITNVSHDLKTPLTSIINYIDLLEKEDLTEEEMKSYIKILDKKSQRLKVLIEDLFEASKVASGSIELNIEKVDIAELLNQTLAELDEKIQNSSLIFKVNIPKEKVYVNLDGKKTFRVFENLINNILKYSQPETRVYIDLIEKEDKNLIIMKNISSYEMDFDVEEIFDRFKRGDKSRETEGSGLGLAIAKSIVELQGGKLNIEIDGDLFKAVVEFNIINIVNL